MPLSNLSLHNMHMHITVLLNNILTNHMHIIILLPNAYSCNHSDVLLYVQEGEKMNIDKKLKKLQTRTF